VNALPESEKLLRSRSNVLDDLAEQEGGDIASAMYRNSGPATVWVVELPVGTSLPYLFEPHSLEYRDNLSRSEDG
jgi:hypothetical protein